MLRSKWKLVLVLVISLICNTLGVVNLPTVQAAGVTVVIKAMANSQFVCADKAGADPLIANRASVGGDWEKYERVDLGGGVFAFKSLANQQYVSANNTGSILYANKTTISDWEKFLVVTSTEGIGLKCLGNNKFVTAENQGKLPLQAVRDSIGGYWEEFVITEANGEVLPPSYKIYGYISSATEGSKVGFTVTLQGTDKTATTDSDGYFYITGINTAATNLSLKISKIQYLSRIIQIGNISDSLQISTPEAPINMWAGDLNQDGAINMSDVIEITKSFNSSSGDGRYVSLHDLNKDSAVNMSDILIVASHFNTTNANYAAINPAPIRHSFIAVDESRAQLHFVDQNDHSKDWNISLPYHCRDYQLIGNQQLLLNGGDGYYIYDLTTKKMLKEFHNPAYANTQSVRRTTDGHTFIGCTNSTNNGFVITELDASDKAVKTATFSGMSDLRLMRFSSKNTLLFGGANTAVEADMTGKIYRKISIPNTTNIYQVLERPNGGLLISTGYSVYAGIYDINGNLVKKFGGNPAPESNLNYNFFGGIQVLKNGNIVITNWTGHNSGDSSNGVQLLEFTSKGDLVWSWHDPILTGSIHGVIVMDGVDPNKFYDDRTGVLQPVN